MSALPESPEDRAARWAGTTLAGKYHIERLLGVGGMASVYAGVHRNGRRVAIKILHQELGIAADIRARFVREGYVANAVGHPGAVHVYDDDVAEDGAVFLVMELLEGETLSERCRRRGGTLPCQEVLALAHQLLDVLAAAHAAGVVHRDIKPDNLFLTTERALKVLDFGIARVREGADGGAHVTATGMRIGTPAFMPPEQALGRTTEIDARTDVWAVGATMFALLAGRTVHTAPSGAEMIVVTATRPAPSLAEHAPSAPSAVVAVVDRALAFSRDARWPDARSMQRALEEAHLESYGEALSPTAVGLPPLARPVVSRATAERDTVSAEVAHAATLPTPPASPPASVPTRVLGPKAAPSPGSTRVSRQPSSPGSQPAPAALEAPEGTISPPSSAESNEAHRRSGRLRWSLIAAGLVAVVGATFGVARWTAMPGAGPPPQGSAMAGRPTSSSAASSAAPAARCTTNIDCKGSGPAICRKDDGVCIALETDQCKVLASPGDVENDATVWIGAMFPTSVPEPTTYGPKSGNAVELARRDFATMTGGLLPVRPGAPKRPIAVVLCDDREAPEPAARHLVTEVRVPAILGFALSKEVMDLATSLFNPKGVLALAANTASALRDIPRSPSGERLVWRVTTSSDMSIPALAAVVSSVIEPEIRAQPGSLAPGEPIRVALVRVANPTGQSHADVLGAVLRVNGKSVAENGDRIRQFEAPHSFSSTPGSEVKMAAQITEFLPHLIIHAGGEELPVEVERSWPRAARFRPRHATNSSYLEPGLAAWLREHPELRKRYYAVDAAAPRDLVTRFVLRYNEVFTPKTTVENATAASYDAFYLFAYAAAALGEEPITGPALARALRRLLPGGAPVDVGPGGIYQAFYALAEGKNIDLRGIQTSLDFDLRTGDATVDFAAYCVSPSPGEEPPRPIESGLFFRSASGNLDGAHRCP
jgi:serine/threonine protein kinase